MGTKDTRAAHGAVAKKDMLLFDPEELVLVTDEKSDLYDDRVQWEPSEALILNVAHYGILEPVIVRKNPETGKTEVVDGRQRVRACRAANKILKKRGEELHRVPAVVRRGDAGSTIGVMISANEQRAEDTPLNRARKASRMLERGKSEEEVGIALGVSVATVKNLLKLLDAPAAVRHAVESGKITTTDAYKLARLEPSEAKEKVQRLVDNVVRAPGKKRVSRTAARKAREIVDGKSSDLRSANIVENVLREIQEKKEGVGDFHRGFAAALEWTLGDDEALGAVLS